MVDSLLRRDVGNWLKTLADVPSDALLAEMHALAAEQDFPIVGPEVGRLLAQLARLCSAQRIFEMGSGFGYSTLWFARAVGAQGNVVHTDGDPANTTRARAFLAKAGVESRVTFLTGDARELLAATTDPYDLIFCDIDKEQYPAAYELMRHRVRPGGLIVIDNLIWSGRVAAGETDAATQGIREYIRRMWSDEMFLSSLVPVRDGVGVSLRLS